MIVRREEWRRRRLGQRRRYDGGIEGAGLKDRAYLGYLLLLHQNRFPRRDGSGTFFGAEDVGAADFSQTFP